MKKRIQHQRLPLHARLTAALSVALLLLLIWLAADPAAHAWLHAHSHGSENDTAGHTCPHCSHHQHDDSAPSSEPCTDSTCVINLFASGHFAALATFFLLLIGLVALAALLRQPLVRFLSPDFSLPPTCGPPVWSAAA